VLPDPNTAFVDPFIARPTLSMICDVQDPLTREPYGRDPRGIAKKAEAYLKSTGIGDTAWFGPEAEFFIFDSVRYETGPNVMFHQVDGLEAPWRSAEETEDGAQANRGYKIAHKEGYLPVPPQDKLQDVRDEMVAEMEKAGIEIETHHHEVATAGQAEIDMRFTTLLKMADQLCLYKYIVKNVAYRNGKTATFMPKPMFADNGSGMHCHSSIWKDGKPTFAGNGYAGLSENAIYYIGGLLKHASAICAITNPTNNSYKRLVPGFEAPVNLAYSARNRSAICRIPTYSPSPKAKRVEFRSPDPAANPYLTFAAILLAGLDGIKNKIHPGEPMDKNLYDLPPEEAAKIKTVPASLKLALEALEADHGFLTVNDVFPKEFIDIFIELKIAEYDAVRIRPHPHEFVLYYDV
jgi:glutamine synthetase